MGGCVIPGGREILPDRDVMLRLEGREGSMRGMASGNPLERESSGKKNPRADLSLIREKPSEGHSGWITVWEQNVDKGDERVQGSFRLFLLHSL